MFGLVILRLITQNRLSQRIMECIREGCVCVLIRGFKMRTKLSIVVFGTLAVRVRIISGHNHIGVRTSPGISFINAEIGVSKVWSIHLLQHSRSVTVSGRHHCVQSSLLGETSFRKVQPSNQTFYS